jgi:Fe-S cluster biogenesis protein NfuA
MENTKITQLFTTAGLSVELVYEGSCSGCPHCATATDHRLAEAA